MKYVVLNTAVLLLVLVWTLRRKSIHARPLALTIVSVLSLTAVFDSLIIAAGIVDYNSSNILGLYVGRAPIEDFAYAIVSVLLVVILWERDEKR